MIPSSLDEVPDLVTAAEEGQFVDGAEKLRCITHVKFCNAVDEILEKNVNDTATSVKVIRTPNSLQGLLLRNHSGAQPRSPGPLRESPRISRTHHSSK